MKYKFNQIRDGRYLALYVNRYVYDELDKGSNDHLEDLVFQGLYNSMDPSLNTHFENYFLTISHNHLDFLTKDYMFSSEQAQSLWSAKFMNFIAMITNKCELQFMKDFHENIKALGLPSVVVDEILTKAIAEFHYDLFDSLKYQDFYF